MTIDYIHVVSTYMLSTSQYGRHRVKSDDGDAKPQLYIYIYICWSSVEGCWCISECGAKSWLAMDAISLLNLALIYKVCLLNGYVSIPVMKP